MQSLAANAQAAAAAQAAAVAGIPGSHQQPPRSKLKHGGAGVANLVYVSKLSRILQCF